MSNFSTNPQAMFEALASEHRPKFRFEPGQDHAAWRAEALPAVFATLGKSPEAVPANASLLGEWLHDGLRKQKWIIDVGPHIAATFLINYPGDLAEGEKRPSILCWHGHGKHGKDVVMGDDFSPAKAEEIASLNYNYGHQMAKAGFITFAIDWIGGGERNPSNHPHFSDKNHGADWCQLLYLHATMMGMTSLSINLAHQRAATDFALTLPGVDADRLGVMGLSGGGTMTLWTALSDARFKAAEIVCYSQLWADFGIRDCNYCGMQVAPGLYDLVDLPDLQGLLAPLPLLVDVGAYDHGFKIDSSMKCHRRLEEIYATAGAGDKLELDLFAGDHAWGGNKSVAFFGKYLVA
jgi:dienelactone hydrolase